MNIEKPISTVRKAIERGAEKIAKDELLETPETRHYWAVLENFKLMRKSNPQMLEKIIVTYAKAKELRDELGVELDSVFQEAWDEISNKIQIQETKNLTPDELHEEFYNLTRQVLKKTGDEVKNNPKIISSFLGKEKLLNRVVNFYKEDCLELLKEFEKYSPNLK